MLEMTDTISKLNKSEAQCLDNLQVSRQSQKAKTVYGVTVKTAIGETIAGKPHTLRSKLTLRCLWL